MDAFFASVEIADHPQLRGKPVIVGHGDRGVVTAASYEARPFGVRSAMPMTQARRLCPQAIVVPPHHERYREVSSSVMNLLHQITPVMEAVSIDEAFLDVTGSIKRAGSPVAIAQRIRHRVEAEHNVTCSVGVASSTMVAKLASTHAKPDGLLLIPDQRALEFLHQLPVGALQGVGPKTEKRLSQWGINTVKQLAHTEEEVLFNLLGKTHTERLKAQAWHQVKGTINPHRVEKSVGTETTLEADSRDRGEWRRIVWQLSNSTARRAQKSHVAGKVVVLKVRTGDFETFTRSRTIAHAINGALDIYQVAKELLTAHAPSQAVRLLGVRLEGLIPADEINEQLTLDPALEPASTEDSNEGKQIQETHVTKLWDQLRDRFGDHVVMPGSLVVNKPRVRNSSDTGDALNQ